MDVAWMTPQTSLRLHRMDSSLSHPGPLYGLPCPTIDHILLESRILSIVSQTSFSQSPTPDIELAACRALWNARKPINNLPVELLVDILMRLPSNGFDVATTTPSSTSQCFQCMCVCRHWRTVIASNGCFWRTIHTGERTRWLQLSLARAGAANLRLKFTQAAGLISALPDLLSRRDHIERLDFTCQTLSDIHALAPLICAPLPCMSELAMLYGNVGNSSTGLARKDLLALQPENFPALIRLRLVHASLPWTVSLLSRLRSLHLGSCQVYPSPISVSRLSNVLRCGNALEELTLHDFLGTACSADGSGLSQPMDALTLPRLRKLDISDAPAWIAEFVAYIQLPPEGDVILTGQVEDPQAVSALGLASMLPQNHRGAGFLRSATGASLFMLEGKHWVVCEAPGPLKVTLQLRARTTRVLWTQTLDDGLRHFTTLFHPAPLTALTLQCDLAKVAPDALADALDAFPHIQELTIASSTFGPDPFPMHLCDSLRARTGSEWEDEKDGGRGRVRCASLKVLCLENVRWEDGAFMNAVADCLRERERLGAPKLELLAITASRSPEVDWSEPDARFADILAPMVGEYEFCGKGW
ncbi:hypothetical protein TRAPUB_5326 [Trametes pubescens]|uniref:F-box domain-containing protein n=1 Tax=Trametes pubescens TaxID=154538 RepID=A0A1M2V8W9_TRAPU|nr:hypothetical protein TRAPUB_5326 [Trametes pubescens]